MAVSSIALHLTGLPALTFMEISGGGSHNPVVVQQIAQPDGTLVTRKLPGTLVIDDVTLGRLVDRDRTLWDWRQQVVDGAFAAARKNGTIVLFDSAGTAIATYAIENAWPSAYVVATGTTASAAIVERITVSMDRLSRP